MGEANANEISESHSHIFLAPDHEASEKRTWAVIVLCGVMMAAEIVGGLLFGSIALIADGLHMSTHAGALLLAALAYSYARKHASDTRFCFGTGKLGDLAGFTSAIVLAMIAVLIGYESVTRLFQPVPIHFAEAIPIACLGLVVNIVSAWLLSSGGHHHGHGYGHGHGHGHDDGHDHEESRYPEYREIAQQGPAHSMRRDFGHRHDHGDHQHAHGHRGGHDEHDHGHGAHPSHEPHEHHHDASEAAHGPHDDHHSHSGAHRDNNMRAAVIHVAADAAVSILVIVGLLLARAFGWLWMDPLAGIVGACVIASWSYGLIRDTGAILLDMNPDPNLANQLRQAIEVDGDRLDDLHLWRVGPGHLAAIVSVATRNPHHPGYYRDRLSASRSSRTSPSRLFRRIQPDLLGRDASRVTAVSPPNKRQGSAAEVGAAFLKLGLSSFGGPIAHLAYFRREFVERRGWIDAERFGHLLGLCQFLPGPASSQLGFSLGLLRAGWPGAFAAFICFTLPSALLMLAFAVSSDLFSGVLGGRTVHGLKLVAVVVVAQGVLGLARTLTPDPPRAMMAAVAASLAIVSGNAWMQLVVVAGGAILGPWLCRPASRSSADTSTSPAASFTLPYGRRLGGMLILSFAILLALALLIAPTMFPTAEVAGAFFRAGALVFGGGHVVLPLLEHSVVDSGWIDGETFLAGYGAAQALPGPMFTFAAFLGERLNHGPGGITGALVGLLAIFLPGLLLVAGVLPYWQALSKRSIAARSLAGVNAAVVGLLAAALYDPVWLTAVKEPTDVAIALLGFVLLVNWRWPVWAVVGWCVVASTLRGTV